MVINLNYVAFKDETWNAPIGEVRKKKSAAFSLSEVSIISSSWLLRLLLFLIFSPLFLDFINFSFWWELRDIERGSSRESMGWSNYRENIAGAGEMCERESSEFEGKGNRVAVDDYEWETEARYKCYLPRNHEFFIFHSLPLVCVTVCVSHTPPPPQNKKILHFLVQFLPSKNDLIIRP